MRNQKEAFIPRRAPRRLLSYLLYAALLLLVVFIAGERIEASSRAGRAEAAERALRQAAVHCYALEGFFPPTLAYLEKNYALRVDRESFIVHYSIFASNLMPDIDVIARGTPGG